MYVYTCIIIIVHVCMSMLALYVCVHACMCMPDLPTCAIIYAGHTAHFCRTFFTNCRTDNYILEKQVL